MNATEEQYQRYRELAAIHKDKRSEPERQELKKLALLLRGPSDPFLVYQLELLSWGLGLRKERPVQKFHGPVDPTLYNSIKEISKELNVARGSATDLEG